MKNNFVFLFQLSTILMLINSTIASFSLIFQKYIKNVMLKSMLKLQETICACLTMFSISLLYCNGLDLLVHIVSKIIFILVFSVQILKCPSTYNYLTYKKYPCHCQ